MVHVSIVSEDHQHYSQFKVEKEFKGQERYKAVQKRDQFFFFLCCCVGCWLVVFVVLFVGWLLLVIVFVNLVDVCCLLVVSFWFVGW